MSWVANATAAVPRALPQLAERKYHTIDALNHAWWTSFWSHHYDSFDEVEPPFDNGEQSLNGLKLDWRRFTTWNMMDYVHSETAILRKRTPMCPLPRT